MSMEIPLSRGLMAVVDDSDYETVLAAGQWHAQAGCRTNYARRSLRNGGLRSGLSMHRFLTGWAYIDHVNGNGLDNRRANLRPATPELNQANRGPQRNNRSGFKGVFLDRESGLWRAGISVEKRSRALGRFSTPENAARAYDAAAIAAWGEFARLNFPREAGP